MQPDKQAVKTYLSSDDLDWRRCAVDDDLRRALYEVASASEKLIEMMEGSDDPDWQHLFRVLEQGIGVVRTVQLAVQQKR